MEPNRDRRAAGTRRTELRAGQRARLETRARPRSATRVRHATTPPRQRARTRTPVRTPPRTTARTLSRAVARTVAQTRARAIARRRALAQRRARRPKWRPKPKTTRRRLIGLLVALVVVFVAVAARLVDLQALGRDRYAQLGLDQRVRTVQLAAERGSVFDRNGHDLAVSVPQQTVWANPRVVTDPAAYAAKLAPVVGGDEAVLRERLSQRHKAFVYIARKVDNATVLKVKALGLPGVDLVPESKRFYPDGAMAGPVLGFVGTDNDGLGGLEAQYEKRLAGKPGELSVELDPQGRQLPGGTRRVVPSQRGGDLVLTIDQNIQYHAEQVLAQEVTNAKAKGGVSIVMDVTTGDVLAMASVDGAVPNGRPAGPSPANERNRPVVDVYEPGSTNKVITVAGALEDQVVTPDSVFPTPGELVIGGTAYADTAAHPTSMPVREIVRQSSNVGTIQIARQLGKERFDAYLRAFGYGSATGLGFPGEANGLLLPLSQYTETSMGSMPIGNGLSVTAMQMLDVYTTLANGGATRPPRLVAATVGPDGARHDEPAPPSRQVVSPGTATTMRELLLGVVENGTGTKAKIPGYQVAGKTGTARKPPYDPPYRYVASFAGFAPVEAPQLSAIVVLDEPQDNYFGGQVAAPVFARVLEFALRAERVLPGAAAAVPPAPPATTAAPAGTSAKGGASVPADSLTPAP